MTEFKWVKVKPHHSSSGVLLSSGNSPGRTDVSPHYQTPSFLRRLLSYSTKQRGLVSQRLNLHFKDNYMKIKVREKSRRSGDIKLPPGCAIGVQEHKYDQVEFTSKQKGPLKTPKPINVVNYLNEHKDRITGFSREAEKAFKQTLTYLHIKSSAETQNRNNTSQHSKCYIRQTSSQHRGDAIF